MCKDIDACIIRKSFAAAGTIVFPSDMQRHLYDGMFRPDAGHTIYNGSCAAFKTMKVKHRGDLYPLLLVNVGGLTILSTFLCMH